MSIWNKMDNAIPAISGGGRRIGWILILYMMTFGLTDVFLRYIFNAPSMWIATTLQFSMVLLVIFEGADALHSKSFVRMDVFYVKMSPRGRAISDLCTSWLILLFCVVLIWKGIELAQFATGIRQVTPTAIPFPLYPFKWLVPVGVFAVLLVALQKLAYDIKILLPTRKS